MTMAEIQKVAAYGPPRVADRRTGEIMLPSEAWTGQVADVPVGPFVERMRLAHQGEWPGLSPDVMDRLTLGEGRMVTKWVGDENADRTPEATVTGIILGTYPYRAMYREAYDPTVDRRPPACVSRDAKVGVGQPGGDCTICRYAAFGSALPEQARGENAPACGGRTLVFILEQGEEVPTMLDITATPAASLRQGLLRMLRKGVDPWAAVYGLTLVEYRRSAKIRLDIAGLTACDDTAYQAGYYWLNRECESVAGQFFDRLEGGGAAGGWDVDDD